MAVSPPIGNPRCSSAIMLGRLFACACLFSSCELTALLRANKWVEVWMDDWEKLVVKCFTNGQTATQLNQTAIDLMWSAVL